MRTEWYAQDIGLVLWIDHWDDHDDPYVLVYALSARTAKEYGNWPREVAAC